MKIYFSGNDWEAAPERLLAHHCDPAGVMLSFKYILSKADAQRRLKSIIKEGIRSQLFVDSGAFSLFLEQGERGKNPSFFSLKKGAEFRRYCDRYADFVKRLIEGHGGLFANVDVIYDPLKTYEVQRFFENEHGLRPVPVVHYKSNHKWIAKYLEEGYPLVGLGGFAWGGSGCALWLDQAFNTFPKLQAHGFALTSWEAIQRWPWFSVDSTTWILTSAYGRIFVPPYIRESWRFDRPPFLFTVTQDRLKSLSPFEREIISHWLETMDLTLDSVSMRNAEDKGDRSYVRRCLCNLIYFKALEEAPRVPQKRMTSGGFGF